MAPKSEVTPCAKPTWEDLLAEEVEYALTRIAGRLLEFSYEELLSWENAEDAEECLAKKLGCPAWWIIAVVTEDGPWSFTRQRLFVFRWRPQVGRFAVRVPGQPIVHLSHMGVLRIDVTCNATKQCAKVVSP